MSNDELRAGDLRVSLRDSELTGGKYFFLFSFPFILLILFQSVL